MKTPFLILLSILSTAGFSQINVPQNTQSFYGVVEATWCGNCGQNGQPSTNAIISNTTGKANYSVWHRSASSDLYSLTAKDIVVAMGISGQPIFTLNGSSYGPFSGTTIGDITSDINSFYNAGSADVNTGFNSTINGDTLYVESKTTFFNAMNGNYSMALYVHEDSIWGIQADYSIGADTNIWHNHVLRTSMNGSLGEIIGTGSISAGTSVMVDYELTLDPLWDYNQLYLTAVIWEENTGNYTVINSNSNGGNLVLSSKIIEDESEILVYPNPSIDELVIESKNQKHIKIYNLSGQMIEQTNAPEGVFILNHNLNSGMYILEVTSGKDTYNQKISVF